MMQASDPVNGTAPSFDAERAVRKHIGDYALFVAGMYPEAMASDRRSRRHHPSLGELIHAGKESYFIVSQFNLFEYEQEAPLFARLSDRFERCILGPHAGARRAWAAQAADAAAAGELATKSRPRARINPGAPCDPSFVANIDSPGARGLPSRQ